MEEEVGKAHEIVAVARFQSKTVKLACSECGIVPIVSAVRMLVDLVRRSGCDKCSKCIGTAARRKA